MNRALVKLRKIDIGTVSVLAAGVFAFLFAIEQIYNYDIWWHLKSGAWIIENGTVPAHDPFSFSTLGERWFNSSWLSGPLFIFIHYLGGIDLLILFKAMIIALSFGGACLYLVRRGVHPVIALSLTVCAVAIARFRFLLRPQMFIFPGVLLLFWFLSRKTALLNRCAFFLVPITILWINLHGSGYLAPVFAFFLFIEAMVVALSEKKLNSVMNLRPVWYSGLLFTSLSAAVVFKPFGFEAVIRVFRRTIYEYLLTNSFPVYIEELEPLQWGQHQPFWALLILSGISFLLIKERPRVFYLLVFAGIAFLSIRSVRFVGFASLVAILLLGLNLQSILDRFPSFRDVLEKWKWAGLIVVLLIGCQIFYTSFGPGKVYRWGLGLNESRFPVGAVSFLKNNGFSGNLFNTWDEGGFILWHMPEVKTLIDGRSLKSQMKLDADLRNMDASALSDYMMSNDVRGALINKLETRYLSLFKVIPNYSLAYFDDKFFVYLRTDLLHGQTAPSRLTFRLIKPESFDVRYLVPLARGPQADAVEQEFLSAINALPKNFNIYFQMAVFLEARNRVEALDYYLEAADINPSLGFSHFNLGKRAGQYALKIGAWQKAIQIIELALQFNRDDVELHFLLGTAFYQLKDYPKAEKKFKFVLAKEPNQVTSLLNLGYLYMDTGRYSDAEVLFVKLIESGSGHESGYYGYALALHKQNNPKTKKAWQDFLKKFPDSRWAAKAELSLRQLADGQ